MHCAKIAWASRGTSLNRSRPILSPSTAWCNDGGNDSIRARLAPNFPLFLYAHLLECLRSMPQLHMARPIQPIMACTSTVLASPITPWPSRHHDQQRRFVLPSQGTCENRTGQSLSCHMLYQRHCCTTAVAVQFQMACHAASTCTPESRSQDNMVTSRSRVGSRHVVKRPGGPCIWWLMNGSLLGTMCRTPGCPGSASPCLSRAALMHWGFHMCHPASMLRAAYACLLICLIGAWMAATSLPPSSLEAGSRPHLHQHRRHQAAH